MTRLILFAMATLGMLTACASGDGYCVASYDDSLAAFTPEYGGTGCTTADRPACEDANGDWTPARGEDMATFCAEEGFYGECVVGTTYLATDSACAGAGL